MSDVGWLPRVVASLVGRAAGTFFQIEREGPHLPEGPVLVVANHPNSLLDPLLIFRTAGRPARPLAKAPLFDQWFVGAFLRALGGLPVYRRQDDPALMHLNERTFDAAIAALRAGSAVQIYPEGTTHSEPSLAPIRTGAARIAFLAEERHDWTLGLRIAPVGLTYTRKAFFRGQAYALYGPSFPVAPFRERYQRDPQEAVQELTSEITRGIESLTLNFTERHDRALVEAAERLYAREKGWAAWREREALGQRFPRLQAFAGGLAWLRANDPERHERLRSEMSRYRRRATALGALEGDVPPSYASLSLVAYVIREVAPFALGLPVAALGTVLWYPAYWFPRTLTRLANPAFEAVSSYKLSFALLSVPLVLGSWTALAWRLGGWKAALGAAVGLIVVGAWAIVWKDRWSRLSEDWRLFRRAVRHPARRESLAAQRGALVAEFDDVVERMGRE